MQWLCICLARLYLAILIVPVVVRSVAADDFSRASADYRWRFPLDHGQHQDFQSEWWYYTGQLYEQGVAPFAGKPRLGFQLTFFRKGSNAAHSAGQDYMAHAVITDLVAGRTIFESRVGGGALGLSGVSASSLQGWSGDWSVDPIGDGLLMRFSVRDRSTEMMRFLRLHIKDLPKPWLQGRNGMSAKADCQGCASMYYTLPRLSITAQYVDGDKEVDLAGLGWMDHEFMTNSLSPTQVGWDWMGLMLKDGRSIMLFKVRSKDSSSSEYIAGGIQRGEGNKVLTKGDFTVIPVSTWTSPRSRASYPVAWRVQIPSESIDVTVSARVADCELDASDSTANKSSKGESITYWEGPVASSDESVVGYLEMTGYAGAIALMSEGSD